MNPALRPPPRGPLRLEADVHCWKDLREPPPPWQPPEGVSVGVGDTAETMQAAALRRRDGGELAAAEYASRLRRGHLCFVARRGAAVVGSNWLAFGSGEEGPVRIVLGPGEVLMLDAFIAQSERGRGIHTALQHRMICWARAQGYSMAHTFLIYRDRVAGKTIERMRWQHGRWPRYVIVSSPWLRRLGLRRQWVIDLAYGRHPIPPGPCFRTPGFEPEYSALMPTA